jgi:hypothetical protein
MMNQNLTDHNVDYQFTSFLILTPVLRSIYTTLIYEINSKIFDYIGDFY